MEPCLQDLLSRGGALCTLEGPGDGSLFSRSYANGPGQAGGRVAALRPCFQASHSQAA